MFGIGLPEMILIMALALIVVGPDKLPDLARSLAKGLMELKNTAESLKDSLTEEGNPLDEIRPDLEEAAQSFKKNLLDVPADSYTINNSNGVNPVVNNTADAYQELMQHTPASTTSFEAETGQQPQKNGIEQIDNPDNKNDQKALDKNSNSDEKDNP